MSFAVAMLCIHTSPLDLPGLTRDAGGMNVYIRELALELASFCTRIARIDIFTRRVSEDTPQVVWLAPNVRVIHIQAGPITPLHKDELYQYIPLFVCGIAEFCRLEAIRYDVVHSHYWLSSVAATRLSCHWDIPHIAMFHTLGRLKQLANPKEVEPPLRLEIEQRLLHQVDRIIASTADERSQMIRYYRATASRITVIPCGVDLRLFVPHQRSQVRERLGLSADRPIALFVGRLDTFKGPDVLLQAVSMMQQDALVVIIGGRLSGDTDIQSLRILAQDLGIADRVSFLGARSHEEMPLLYSAANVTVIPSYHETFGLAAVESLACGTPVVATRAGGLTTIVKHGETGYLVPRCPGFFAERMDVLLTDPVLYTRLALMARSSVQRFSWQVVAQEVSAVYEELTSEKMSLLAQ
jgi:D-inositol-3-phosphate glycosyltransferase